VSLLKRRTAAPSPHGRQLAPTQRPGRDFRYEHEQIVRDAEWMRLMASRVPSLSIEERRALVAQAVAVLRRIGIHVAAEERLFYPVLARLLGTPRIGDAMTADHRYVHARTQYLAGTDPASTAALQAILYGLHAVITTHVQKEDEILMPLVKRMRAAAGRTNDHAPGTPVTVGPSRRSRRATAAASDAAHPGGARKARASRSAARRKFAALRGSHYSVSI
jgi:hypothetical protein